MTTRPEIQRIVDAIRVRRRFVLSSHSRPAGDSIGSQLAMAYALAALGKEAIAVNADPAPPPLRAFPGVPDIRIAAHVEGDFDAAAAACGEMVFDVIRALGVPLSTEMATHIYLAILTDTGSFHYSSISPRTFDICGECLNAGVDPVLVARNVYDSNNMGRLKLFGAVLSAMQIDQS